MKIFRQLAEVPTDYGPSIATIGNFDGVHRGHQWVIAEVVARARALGQRSIAITFDPHPARVIRPESSQPLITPLNEKLEMLSATGIDATLILPFTEELSRMTARTFATNVLQRTLHVTELHEGENFRFGYQAHAGIESLEALGRELGFSVRVYAPRNLRGEIISSSRIRQLVADGDLSHVRALLGRSFSVRSTPASGRGYGTRYTVPTINLTPYPELLADSFAVESYLLNFHPIDLNESTPLTLTFLRRLRAEMRWPNPEALKEQIGLDVAKAKRYFTLCRVVGSRPRSAAPLSTSPAL
jgi:riboflavin kinase / FMN adenylyltransferase